MSIDYGSKRIGIAVSDELHLIAHPLSVIKNDKHVFDKIRDLVTKHNVGKIVVGIPEWEKESQIIPEIKQFVEKLKSLLNVEIEFVNEFYSTKIATEKIVSLGKKLKKYKHKLDSYAACVFLQEYLDINRNKNER